MGEFINRIKEQQLLCELLTPKETSKVIILYSNSGLGKSAFAKKIADDNENLTILRVDIQDTKNNNGFYIKKIAEAIDKNKNFLTLYEYIKQADHLINYNNELFDKITNIGLFKVFKSLKYAHDKQTSSGQYNNRFFLENEDEQILLLKDYIVSAFSDKKVILNIDNIQAIDQSSYEQLRKIFEECRHLTYFFEYTVNSSNIEYKIESFKSASPYKSENNHSIELKKLPILEYLCPRMNDEQMQALKIHTNKSYYREYDGNLRNLEDQLVIAPDNIAELTNGLDKNLKGTQSRLSALSSDEKLMIALIVTHRGEVPIEFLSDVHYNVKGFNINFNVRTSIDILTREDSPLINKYNDLITINHDDVSRAMEKVLITSLIQGYDAWSNFYEEFYKNNNFDFFSRRELLSNLFYFYANGKEEKLFNIIIELKKFIVQSKYPLQSIKYLYKLQKSSNSSPKVEKINYHLIDIFYYLGQFNDCNDILKSVYQKTIKYIVYKSAILNRLDKHDEALFLVTEALKNVSQNTSFHLVLQIIAMISHRSLNSMKKAEYFFKQIHQNKSFHDLYEYGFLLRNADIVRSFKKSIPYIKQSIDFFHKRKDHNYQGHSLISLGMQYARLGELDKAKKSHEKAQELLFDYSLEKHIIMINLAVISIFEDKTFSYTMSLLTEAKKDATTSFDRLALHNNMFVLLIKNEKYNEANEIQIHMLSILENQTDKAVHRTIFYNIAQYYKNVVKHEEYHTAFINKAINTFKHHDNYWEYRLFGKKMSDENFLFLSKFDYHLSFLSYWHFDLSKVDKHL